MNPLVSFVVPCYNLAVFLQECVDSILQQTYTNIEVLIMDDCSPDNTPEVAASFKDSRVRHVRNNPNLGHLRNYNRGIELARGKYLWLISADDALRKPYVLEKFVRLMEEHPELGYVFCPGMDLCEGKEAGILRYSTHGDRDAIFRGREFLLKLVHHNSIVSPSVMARTTCYREDPFPLTMPWGADWYLWCMFALKHEVGYFAEPMVYYRRHTGSMTTTLTHTDLGSCASDDITIPWVIKREVERRGESQIVAACLNSIAEEYARSIASKRYKTSTSYLSLKQFEQSLDANTSSEQEKRIIRARTYEHAADHYCWREEYSLARSFYWRAFVQRPSNYRAGARAVILSLGAVGVYLRKAHLALRQSRMNGARS